MFVQIVRARVADAAAVHAAHDRWFAELAAGAPGWLGTTAGVSGDGDFIRLARFESQALAEHIASRPEQVDWWAQTAELFTGEVSVTGSSAAYLDRGGASPEARFVQVIQRRVRDLSRARQILKEISPLVAQVRPEDIGTLIVEHDGDRFTVAVYFTCEHEARGTERAPAPALRALREEQNALGVEPPRFYDLRQPWHYPPR